MIPVVPVVTISTAHLGSWLVDAFPKSTPFVGECPGGPGCEGWERCSVCDATCWVIPPDRPIAKDGGLAKPKPYRGTTGPGKDPRAIKCTHCKFRGWEACICNDPIHIAIVLGVRVERVRLQVVLEGLPDITRACVDDGHLCFPKTNPIAPYTFGPHEVRGVEKPYFGTRTVPLPLGAMG